MNKTHNKIEMIGIVNVVKEKVLTNGHFVLHLRLMNLLFR